MLFGCTFDASSQTSAPGPERMLRRVRERMVWRTGGLEIKAGRVQAR
jgi:hypothetical protein